LKDLREKSKLPERTLRFSLSHLKKEGIVSEFFDSKDVRRKILKLNLNGGKNGN
jgi:hypothetical protein